MFSLASCSQPVICDYNPENILMSFFARLYGSYEDLQIGQVSEALVDFTGGVNTRIKLAEAPPDLWDILTRATYSRSLMGCQTHLGVRLGVPFQIPHVTFCRTHILHVKLCSWIDCLMLSAPCLGTGLFIKEILLNRDLLHFPIFIK